MGWVITILNSEPSNQWLFSGDAMPARPNHYNGYVKKAVAGGVAPSLRLYYKDKWIM
jgi:hypothetical protein